MSELEELSESRNSINENDKIIEIKDSKSKKIPVFIGFLILLIIGLSVSLGIVSYRLLNNGKNVNNNKSNVECPESNVILEDSNHDVYNFAEYLHNIQENLGVNMTLTQTYKLVDDFIDSFSSLSVYSNKSDDDSGIQDSLLHSVPNELNLNEIDDDGNLRRLQTENRVCTDAFGYSSSTSIFYYLVSSGYSVLRIYTFYSTQINGFCLLFIDGNLYCTGSLTGNLYTATASSGFCSIQFCVGTNFIESLQYQACNGYQFPLLGGPGGNCFTLTPSGDIQLDAFYGYQDNTNNIITAIGFCYSSPL